MKKKIENISVVKVILVVVLSLFALLTIYPFYNVILISLTPYKDAANTGFYLIPRSIDLNSYLMLFKDMTVPRGFFVTVTITVVGTLYSLFLTITMGYALAKKGYPGRTFFLYFVLFTMFFNGGLIPYYLVVRSIGLVDSIFSMIIPAGISTFYLILMKNFFASIPDSIEESAKIDGANELIILFRIVLPVAAPILATIGLFYAVDRWNEYFNAMLFIRTQGKRPIQTILREMLVNQEMALSGAMSAQMSKKPMYVQSLRMAIVVVTSVPIILVYPFLQKHFTKGIMIGAIKA